MKVLMLNGSPRKDGNTSIALEEMKKIFEAEGVETEIVRVGNKDVRGCIARSEEHTSELQSLRLISYAVSF